MDKTRSRSGLNRRGQALAEYATLVALIGAALVVILGLFARTTRQVWDQNASAIRDKPSLGYGGGGGGGGGGPYSGSVGTPVGVRPTVPDPPAKNPADSAGASESPGPIATNEIPQ